MKELTPQEVLDRLNELSEIIKTATEEKLSILKQFHDKFEDYEVPVLDDGKAKFLRVYKPEGRFVYNCEYEVGLRAKAQNLFENKIKG